jgi:hypothetical protein
MIIIRSPPPARRDGSPGWAGNEPRLRGILCRPPDAGSADSDAIVSLLRQRELKSSEEQKGVGRDSMKVLIVGGGKRYVVGAVHTNTIEGFWSIFKRGVVGSFHKVSRKYLPLYVAEFPFRYNNRFNSDIFGTAIAGA